MYVCMYVCVCIYIYIQRQRERERYVSVYVCICICMYVCIETKHAAKKCGALCTDAKAFTACLFCVYKCSLTSYGTGFCVLVCLQCCLECVLFLQNVFSCTLRTHTEQAFVCRRVCSVAIHRYKDLYVLACLQSCGMLFS